MIEEWRPVALASGYEVSDQGQIRNARTGHVLRPWVHKSGHLYVGIGRKKRAQVHHLVMAAFGTAKPPGMECRHDDGNPKNNKPSNLLWGTRQDNIEDLKRTSGRYARSHLSDGAALSILASLKRGNRQQLADLHGVTIHVINDLATGRTYDHLHRL